MKKKSDYAIILSCNPGYGFGMMATMNAQAYFGTDADWEIAYEGFSPEYREKVSNAFDFNVNWTPISELMQVVVDKRTDQRAPLERFWLCYWLMAHKVLKEGKYKAVCVIQADQFVFVNLDHYFKLAEEGFIVSSKFHCTGLPLSYLKFGDDKCIWDRSMCPIFDSVTFLSQKYTDLPINIIHFQEEDAFKGESNHSVICLNRAVCRHGKADWVIGLDGGMWVCDAGWGRNKFNLVGDEIFDSEGNKIKSWHCRWWQIGRVAGEWAAQKHAVSLGSYKHLLPAWDLQEHNFNLVKSFMERFNDMRPEIRSEAYLKGPMRRVRYEEGEV